MTRTRLAWATAALMTAAPAGAATLCVNTTGSGGCQSTIQGAVTAAAGGDTIKIAAGTYFENVTVPAGKDGLQILGASKLTTILDADLPNSGNGFTIQSNNVKVSNLGVQNGAASGIVVAGSGAIIQGVRVVGAHGTTSVGIQV